MAEALLKKALAKEHPEVSVTSAGLGALIDHPADANSLKLMQAQDIDISAHRARQITPELVFGSDLILTMSTEQTEQVEKQFPSAKGRVHRIGKWGEYNIVDPFKRPEAIFKQALTLIEQGIDDWHKKLWN